MNTDLRTVVLLSDYSLSYLGGAQVAFIRQAEALLNEGLRVFVVAPGAKKALSHKRSPFLTVLEPDVAFNIPFLGLPLITNIQKLEERIQTLLKNNPVDAFLLHSEFTLAGVALRLGKKHDIPVLHTVHTFFWQAPKSLGMFAPLVTAFHTRVTGVPKNPRVKGEGVINNALRSMTLRVADRADRVLSPSKHQAEKLRAAGLKNVTVVSNVVQNISEEQSRQPATTGRIIAVPIPFRDPDSPANNAELIIVWAARFAPEKRLKTALDSIAIFQKKESPERLLLQVAGGKVAGSAGIEPLGKLRTSEVGAMIHKAHATLITSYGFDNQPMLALEGFARGKPVIVTDPVLKKEFGDAALLTKNPSAESLAEMYESLLSNPQLLEKASHAAKEYASQRLGAEHVKRIAGLVHDPKVSEQR